MNESKTRIVVIYHGNCHDGFGGAYAAWKKFGDLAAYIPAYDRMTPEANLEGKEVYIIDFSYPKETLLDLAEEVQSGFLFPLKKRLDNWGKQTLTKYFTHLYFNKFNHIE